MPASNSSLIFSWLRALCLGVVFSMLLLAGCGPDREIRAIYRAIEREMRAIEREMDEFAEAFGACTPDASFSASQVQLGARVRYVIQERQDDGCRVSMVYESNPNPEWEGKPLLLTLDSRADFLEEITEGMGSCMSGSESRFACGGPLAELLRN